VRLRGRSLVIASAVGACALGAQASAAPAPTLFRLTVTGTAQAEWTYAAAPVTEGACTRTTTSEGIRSASFRTAKPIVVRISGGKVLPATLRGIRGTVTLQGANTTDTRCSGSGGGSSQIADCAQTRRSFTGATLRIVSSGRGSLSLEPIGNVRLAVASCPLEPPVVIHRPLGPTPKALRLPREVLHENTLARITLSASPTLQTRFGSPEQGRLGETSELHFAFVRIRG
jgi:hypothetical protein